MERYRGRVALVTGASSGIGKAIAIRLAQHGMKVIACARRLERLEEMSAAHKYSDSGGEIIAMKCDLRDESEIMSMFDRIRGELGGVDVCVNNAGLAPIAPLLIGAIGATEQWRDLLNVNILAVSICARESVKTMRERGVDDGAVININSLLGHGDICEKCFAEKFGIYTASKNAVRSMSQGLGNELRVSNSSIRVTEISPGVVKTEVIGLAIGTELAKAFYENNKPMEPDDIADSVVYALSAPPRAQIAEIIIRTTAEARV